jgi:hypothetical protein
LTSAKRVKGPAALTLASLAESAATDGAPGMKAMSAAYATANDDMASLAESARTRGAHGEAWAPAVAASAVIRAVLAESSSAWQVP